MEITPIHIAGILTVMAGAVSILWLAFVNRVNASEKTQKDNLDQHKQQINLCEDRHVEKDKQFDSLRTTIDEAQLKIVDLHGQCEYLRGRQDAVEQFSARVDNTLGNLQDTSKLILAAVGAKNT